MPAPDRSIRLSRPRSCSAKDREVVEERYPGDVIGLTTPGMFAIGDTLLCGQKVEYEGIPCFSPGFLLGAHPNPRPSRPSARG